MGMPSTLGNALLKGLVTLREQKGALNIDDVGELLENMASSLHPVSEGAAGKFLKSEIEKLAQFIDLAKQEVSALSPGGPESKGMDAQQHLDAIVKGTEAASNSIMDAADKIQALAAGIEGEAGAQIMEAANQLYEACTFQDITGQRITKVVTYMTEIDERIAKIIELFGAAPAAGEEGGSAQVISLDMDEKSLLNGPQLPGSTPTQADIDALFNGLNS